MATGTVILLGQHSEETARQHIDQISAAPGYFALIASGQDLGHENNCVRSGIPILQIGGGLHGKHDILPKEVPLIGDGEVIGDDPFLIMGLRSHLDQLGA